MLLSWIMVMLHNSPWDVHIELNRISLPTSYRKINLFFLSFLVNKENSLFLYSFLLKSLLAGKSLLLYQCVVWGKFHIPLKPCQDFKMKLPGLVLNY